MSTIVLNYDSKRLNAVREIADLVAITAGPYGGNVDFHGGDRPEMYRDGKKVLEQYNPADELSLGMKFRMFDAANRTVRKAGDGSTTTTILTRWIFENAIEWIEKQKDEAVSRRDMAQGIRYACRVCELILDEADKLDISTDEGRKYLKMVATLAGSNNEEVGNAVAEVLFKVGIDGFVITEYDNAISNIQYEFRPGYRIPAGVIHKSLLPARISSTTVQNAYVATVKDMITTIEHLTPIRKAWKAYCDQHQQVFPLVLVCGGLDASALASFLHRKFDPASKDHADPMWQMLPNHQYPWYAVKPPASQEVWEDIEAITGSKVISSKEGRSVNYFKPETGVMMQNVVISTDECILNINEPALAQNGLVDRLRDSAKNVTEEERQVIEARIARLEGRVGVVKMPAYSHANLSWTSEVFADAYLASISAIKEGIVPGAGKQLCVLSTRVFNAAKAIRPTTSFLAGALAVSDALACVTRTILENGGVGPHRITAVVGEFATSEGWDTLSLSHDMLQALAGDSSVVDILKDGRETGVIDSAAVIRAAIKSATDEAADWVETRGGVVVGHYRQ